MSLDSSPLPQFFSLAPDIPQDMIHHFGGRSIATLDDLKKKWQPQSFGLLAVGGISAEQIQDFLKNHQDASRLGVIYVGRLLSANEVTTLNNIPQVFKIVDLSLKDVNLKKSLQEAFDELGENKNLSDILDRVRGQNKILQEMNENLGAIVEQRTEHLEISRKEVEAKLREVRELTKFIKSLSSINALEDILLILKQEFVKFHRVRPPLLLYSLSPGNHRCIYFQGQQIIDRSIEIPKSSLNHNDASMLRELLTEALERPFTSVLCVFMNHPDQYGVIVFEHSMDSLEQKAFMNILDRQVESLTVAFDRIALKRRAHEISKQWSSTFDFLQDPIAIIDNQGRVVRSNKTFNQLSNQHLHLFRRDLHDTQPVKKIVNIDQRIFEANLYPIYLSPGERSYNSILHFTDITQATQLQSQLIQSEKMSAIGLLAGNIAHELNNPLTGIKSLSQILQTELRPQKDDLPTSTLIEDLHEVEAAAERSEQIIKNLLEFSSFHGPSAGLDSPTLAPVSVKETVKKTLAFLKTAMRYHNSHIELSEEKDFVVIEPHLLQQVIFNLVNNACQAMGETGDLFLTSEVKKDFIEIKVRDNGPGIPEDIRESIFTPFFTTKEEGKGTGLGLSMSRAIIEKFGGSLTFEIPAEGGTEFIIRLPQVTEN